MYSRKNNPQSGFVMGTILGLVAIIGVTLAVMTTAGTNQARMATAVATNAETNRIMTSLNNTAARTADVTPGGVLLVPNPVKDASGAAPQGGGGYVPSNFGAQVDARGNKIVYCAFRNGSQASSNVNANEAAPIMLNGGRALRKEMPNAPAYAFISVGKNGTQELKCNDLITRDTTLGYDRLKTQEEVNDSGDVGDDRVTMTTISNGLNARGAGETNLMTGLDTCPAATHKLVYSPGSGGTAQFDCVPEGDPNLTGENLTGAGTNAQSVSTAMVFKDKTVRYDSTDQSVQSTLNFRTLRAGFNITLTQSDNDIIISSTQIGGGGGIVGGNNVGNTGSNGTGNVLKDVNNGVMNFRRIISNSNGLSIQQVGDNIILGNTGSTTDLNANNVGDGTGTLTNITRADVFKDKTTIAGITSLNFRRLQGGSNVSLQQRGDTIIINAAGGGGGVGPQGPQGPAGPAGPQGAQGPAGPAGNGSWTVVGNDQYASNSGNVGIGISNPSVKLHVVGGIQGNNFFVQSPTSPAQRMEISAVNPVGGNEHVETQDPYQNSNNLNTNNLFRLYNNNLSRHARLQVEKLYAYDGVSTKYDGVDINFFSSVTSFVRGMKIFTVGGTGATDANYQLVIKNGYQSPFNPVNTFAFKTMGNQYADLIVRNLKVTGTIDGANGGAAPAQPVNARFDLNNQNGFVTNGENRVDVTSLEPGLYSITVYGTLGDAGNTDANGVLIRFLTTSTTNAQDRAQMVIQNHPDGTAPYSVTRLVRVQANGQLTISSATHPQAGGPAKIMGATGFRVSN